MRTRRALYMPGEALEKETEMLEKLKAERAKKAKTSKAQPHKREAKRAAEQSERDTVKNASVGPSTRTRAAPALQEAPASPAGKPATTKTASAAQQAPASPAGKPAAAKSTPVTSPSRQRRPSLPERPVPASPTVRRAAAPAQPPQQPAGEAAEAPRAARQPAPAAARPEQVPTWGVALDAARKRVEDAAVERAVRSGRFVDIAVHSFIPEIPPSRLAVPEDATIDFLKRQIQYRVEEISAHMPADALELQVKDTWGSLTPTTSFTATGAENMVRSYGLVAGAQHHIWVIVVDDTAARNQRAATAALMQLPGPSRLEASGARSAAALPERRLSEPARQAVAQYQAELSPARPAREPAAAANPATGSPGRRRQKNKRWSDEERDALVEGVLIYGTGHWAAILDRFTMVFAAGRNSVDLKDKWRNLVKLVQQKRTARGGELPREQAVKILEVVHREEHPDSEPEAE